MRTVRTFLHDGGMNHITIADDTGKVLVSMDDYMRMNDYADCEVRCAITEVHSNGVYATLVLRA